MKKIFLFSLLSLIIISACKKQQTNPSIVVTASYPTITFATKYYSIPVGGVYPTVMATAYDSFYKEKCTIVTIDSTIHNFVPGVYQAVLFATNLYGYVTYDTFYVAVTNISGALDLSGNYTAPANDSITTVINKLGTGFFRTSNYGGVNNISNPTGVTPGIFAVTSSTSIQFVDGTIGTLSLVPVAGDTTMTYTNGTGVVDFAK